MLKVFLEDTKARKLLICEDLSSMLSCMSSVSKASFSISSGSSSSAAILSSRSLSLTLFRANCSKVFFSYTSSTSEGISLSMRVAAFSRSFVRWALKPAREALCFGKASVILGLKSWSRHQIMSQRQSCSNVQSSRRQGVLIQSCILE